MIIFIDTNIVYNNWHFKSANFKYLLNYLENTNSMLAVSELVCEEVDNKYRALVKEFKNEFSNSIKKGQGLTNEKFDFELSVFDKEYSFKSLLSSLTDRVHFYNYNNIKNEIVVKRAIKKIKPFKDEDKGYRDTLIWLSFLEHVSHSTSENIAFINNNSSDFFDKTKIDFHPHLKEDLEHYEIKNSFKMYDSIKGFIDDEVGNDHKYTSHIVMEEFIDPNERMIEDMVELYINSLSPSWFTNLLKQYSRTFQNLAYLTSFNFKILEGIEDPQLLNWKLVEEDIFYVELKFFLRNVELKLTVPKIIYEENHEELSETTYNIETEQNLTTLKMLQRKIYLNISFNFDTKNKIMDNLDINLFGIM